MSRPDRTPAKPAEETKPSEKTKAAEAEAAKPEATEPDSYALPEKSEPAKRKRARVEVPAELRALAPKIKPEPGLPRADIRAEAHAAAISRTAGNRGAGLPALEPGTWRVMVTKTVLIRGQVVELREGMVVSTATHDVPYLRRAGIVLRPTNDRARDCDEHGFDYDPRATS